MGHIPETVWINVGTHLQFWLNECIICGILELENELGTTIHGCDRVSLLSLSGQLIPGGIQQVCSLLKKTQITPKEFPIAPKPLFKLFVWQQLPSIFLQADSSDNSCVLFFLFFFFSFFFFSFLWRERSFCHIINSNSVSVLFCLSLKWKQWQNCHECVPRKTLEPATLNYGGAIWDVFLETLQELGEERLLFLCDPAHYKPFLFPTSLWTYSISTAL